MVYIVVSAITNNYDKIVLLVIWCLWRSTYTNLYIVAQHLNDLACTAYSASESLDIHCLLDTWVTRHSLWNRHALSYTCCAQHMILVRHELSKWIKCIETHLSKPIWDQKSPPLTWVSKTVGHALILLFLWA